MHLLILAALLFPPPTPIPETGLDTAFTTARASWGQPTPNGYLHGGSVAVARGFQDVTQRIDLTGCIGAKVIGNAYSIIYVHAQATVPVTLDLTGSIGCVLENVTIRADDGGIALKLGRRPDGASAGDHRFINCTFEGPVLNEGSEGNTFIGCMFNGSLQRPALELRNGTPKPYGFTMQAQDFLSCRFNSYQGQPAIVIEVEANAVTTDISFIGGQVATAGGGEAAVVLQTGNAAERQMKQIHFRNMRWETDRKVALLVKGTNGVIGLTLRDSTTTQLESVVRSEGLLAHCVFESLDVYPGDGSNGTHYAIDAAMHGGKVELHNARDFKGATRP